MAVDRPSGNSRNGYTSVFNQLHSPTRSYHSIFRPAGNDLFAVDVSPRFSKLWWMPLGENISRFNCCDPHSLSEVHTFIVTGKNRFGNKIADQLNPAVFRLNRRNTSCNHKLPAFQLTAGLLD